jgi:hypothetical protein
MKKYVYKVETIEVKEGRLQPSYNNYFCSSLISAKKLIDSIITVNKGFEVENYNPIDIITDESAVFVIGYFWDTWEQGESNKHMPRKKVYNYLIVHKYKLINL